MEAIPRQPRQRSAADDPPDSPTSVGWTEAKTIALATRENPFPLETGASIGPVTVEFETYGKLSPARDNAVLITHALSGDAHVAGWDRKAESTGRLYRTRHPGWWDTVIGPGKAIDTNRYCVICSNFLGSCYGTTGPASINPKTGKPYGMAFPVVTVSDWVRLQARLLDALGIERLHGVIGGSLGGQQALEWALAFPERVERSIVLAASPRLSAQGLAFNAVGRHAIMNDPNFRNGDYYGEQPPSMGLGAARMMAHITYLSEEGMHAKFGRRLQDKDKPDFGFGVEFEVESYLDYQARAFVERFDA
ncbi:MAG: homoserine O-acetyltransferase MetX, partial [Bacillota bacterium]